MKTTARRPRWNGIPVESEQAFVLELAHAYALGEAPESTLVTLSTLVPEITSWERVDALLRIHRCTALTYAVLREPVLRDAGIVPDVFFTQKRDWYGASFTRTVMEPGVLHRAIGAFTAAGIPALAIKGLAIGAWLYGDLALREHDDLDLLVPAELGEQADGVLKELGYAGGYRPPLYPGESPATASYTDQSGGIPIDLSFDPLHVFWQSPEQRRASFDGWWDRRQEVHIGNRTVSSPGPEDQLLQLARHLQFHGYFRVNWWVDVLLLLRRFGDGLDWEMIHDEADRHGIGGGIYRTLEIAQSFYGFPIPPAAERLLRSNRAVRALHRRVWPDTLSIPRERPLKDQEGTPIAPRFLTPGGVHPVAGLSLFVLDGQRTKYLRYLAQRVVPPPSWLRETYGAGSYLGLLTEHWRGLRTLRQRVQRRAKR